MGELDAVIPELQELAGLENVATKGDQIIVSGPTKPVLEISHREQGFCIFEQRHAGGFQERVYSTAAFYKERLIKIELLSWVKWWLNEHHRLPAKEEI
jgi:hypothetical protein